MSVLWNKLIRPLAFGLDAERAHELGMTALRSGLAAPFYNDEIDPILSCERFGLKFRSPLGVAAGFDKNGLAVGPLTKLGFGFVEVGTVTAMPQPGNPKRRLFRLPEDGALINRLGFNNDGVERVVKRLQAVTIPCVIGINIGKNKDVPNDEAAESYLAALEAVHSSADYIAVNVSSPNTPGLRELQTGAYLDVLLRRLASRNAELNEQAHYSNMPAGRISFAKPALLVKIAPDLSEDEIATIVDACLKYGIDGIIATNTTVSRSGLRSSGVDALGEGGMSGLPLRQRSSEVIRTIRRLSDGKLPIIGVGGIFGPKDAFEKIAAGACLVQAYTGFVYGGPGFARSINDGLAALLEERGFSSINEAVGSNAVAHLT